MRSAKDIEQSLKRANLDVEVNARTDQAILNELVDAHRKSARTRFASTPSSWRLITGSWTVRLAVGAAIIGIISLLAFRHAPREPRHISPPLAQMSAAEMLTVGQLNAAYRRGGLKELQAQCEKAAEKVDVKTTEISITDLIVELKGT